MFGRSGGKPDSLCPTLNEAVIPARLLGALLTLAQDVEAVGQLSGRVRLRAELRNQIGERSLALVRGMDELMDCLPGGSTLVGRWVPGGIEFLRLQ